MGLCHYVIGGIIEGYKEPAPEGVAGNLNVIATITGPPSRVVIVASYLLIVVYYFTLATVTWVYCAEVWSLGTRATRMGLTAVGNWLFNFALSMFIPLDFRDIGYGLFLLFDSVYFCATAFAFFMYPETCRKTLEEVKGMFVKGGPHPWHTKSGGSCLNQEINEVNKEMLQSPKPLIWNCRALVAFSGLLCLLCCCDALHIVEKRAEPYGKLAFVIIHSISFRFGQTFFRRYNRRSFMNCNTALSACGFFWRQARSNGA